MVYDKFCFIFMNAMFNVKKEKYFGGGIDMWTLILNKPSTLNTGLIDG